MQSRGSWELQRGWPLLHGVHITPFPTLQQVGGTADAEGVTIDHMGVDHRCIQDSVAHELLVGADVLAVLE